MAANKTAFTYNIVPNATGISEGPVHQTDAAWVLTFLRWAVRDTLRTTSTPTLNSTTIAVPPLVVENDCIQLSVSDSKSVLTPSVTATLLITDINYETDLSPGDFVFINILNWEKDARRVATQAQNLQPINGINDGFKGFFKVQSVRKSLITDPQSGIKSYVVKITAFAFTEFNNSIYFNPYLISQSDQNTLLFSSLLGIDWALLQSEKGVNQIQQVVRALIESFVGNGFTDQGKKTASLVNTANTHFYMPQGVGNLLGLSGLKSAKDAYNYLFGIQNYSSNQNQVPQQGMNPSGIPASATNTSRFMYTPTPVDGITVTKPEYWNQVKAWSILNQFTNSPLNELYTCFRLAPNGSVMPTMVFRQIPFTTDNFVTGGSYPVTRFMNVPRWNIDPALAFSFDLGKDEVARINFVQYYGRSVNGPAGYDISDELARHNYLYDIGDVQRNGLRPYVVTSEFDRSSDVNQKSDFRAPGWAKIVGDALIGGELKMSGTINFVGIPDPIAVGDNLQFDNVVYHIEQIVHTAMIEREGKKTFRTSVTVSNGMSVDNGQNVRYPEMTFGGGYQSRKADYDSTQILPGVSESQDSLSRPNGVDAEPTTQESFVQPNTNTSINKSEQ